MKRIGATPGKLALVGVLAVALITVIASQLSNSTAAPQLARRAPTLVRKQSNQTTTPNQPNNSSSKTIQAQTRLSQSKSSPNSVERTSESPTWPDLPLETIVAADPFATPPWLKQARTDTQVGPTDNQLATEEARRAQKAQKAQALKKLQEQGITIVVIAADDKRATIGKQTVRIGDHIEGFVITDITKQGVVLSEFEQR